MKSHVGMYRVSKISITKIGCGLDQMNWPERVKLLPDVFVYSNIHIVGVYTLEGHGVHAMSSEDDPEFNAEDEIKRYGEEVYLDEKGLQTDFAEYSFSCQPPCGDEFSTSREKELNNQLIEPYLQYQPKEFMHDINEFDFQYSDKTDEKLTLLIDMLLAFRHVYSWHKFVVYNTRQKVSRYTEAQSRAKRQRPRKVPLHL